MMSILCERRVILSLGASLFFIVVLLRMRVLFFCECRFHGSIAFIFASIVFMRVAVFLSSPLPYERQFILSMRASLLLWRVLFFCENRFVCGNIAFFCQLESGIFCEAIIVSGQL
jgi:hypothetical protein